MSTHKGRQGEEKAAVFLQRHGYVILGRNIRGGRGEIDIIACNDEVIVFVEVKAHRKRESSIEAVHTNKQRRLKSAAQAWRVQHPQYAALQCRFDLIILTPGYGLLQRANIEHIQDAFR